MNSIRILKLCSAAFLVGICGLSVAQADPVVDSAAAKYCSPPDNARVAEANTFAEPVAGFDLDTRYVDYHVAGPNTIAPTNYTLHVQADIVRPGEYVALIADAGSLVAPNQPIDRITAPILPDQLTGFPHGWRQDVAQSGARLSAGSMARMMIAKEALFST